MEINRVEALKAKEVAEKKLLDKDFVGARVFALKAQNLFAGLDGLAKLVEVINVYCNIRKTINGEVDWYAILGVDSLADNQTLWKHYTRMSLTLQPHKNDSCGASGAYKILSEAWSLLSDPAKRASYDMRQRLAVTTAASNIRPTTTQPPPPPAFLPGRKTFWTKCSTCGTHFEYSVVYIHKLIACARCHSPFWATEERAHLDRLFPKCPSPGARLLPTPPNMATMPSKMSSGVGQMRPMVPPSCPATATQAEEFRFKRKRMMTQIMASKENVSVNKKTKPKVMGVEMRNMLIGKALSEVKKKVEQWNYVTDKDEKYDNDKLSSSDNLLLESSTMSVPDSEFHDFDKDRMEESFAENEVWAAYDCDDGMPRYYAMIKKVMSKRPFKTCISWLNSKTNSELGPMKWVASGFPKTSGDFWMGKSVVNASLNTFSHKVRWAKGSRGVIRIYPSKGDIWALYNEWSPEWNELTPDGVVHKYEMVQIVDEFEEDGVARVVPLVKVHGHRSVFKQHADPNEIRSIPKEEIFRLSHQIPSYVITGSEGPNAPPSTGFLELDPAALPLELLDVIRVEEHGKEVGGERRPHGQEPDIVDPRFRLTYFRKRKGKKSMIKSTVVTDEMMTPVIKGNKASFEMTMKGT
ncbi:unnamed protein product [Cuscuta campestris]|uniref:J domain-containing protein n=1 Tax=Cuscuta campestris TaxID=132261 RepID=A0A484MY19_9ASTE|nr:unnamed protein product [Cuscuta campestris]